MSIKRSTRLRWGLFLIIISFPPWLLIPFVPWFPFLQGAPVKASVAFFLFTFAETSFWIGVLISGADSWNLVRSHGWRSLPQKIWITLKSGSLE